MSLKMMTSIIFIQACNASCAACHNNCGIRTLIEAKTADEFINNFVELNQVNGFFVGFEGYEVKNACK